MTVVINGTTGVTSGSGQFDSASTFGFKNRIINGAMMIDQRNAGASVSVSANSNGYGPDRFRCDSPVGQGITVQQVAPSLSGFSTSLQYTVGTGSTNAGDNSEILQFVEGYNVADLQFGTANAQTIMLSFWAKSSLTGTFGLILENSAANRQYVTTYSLPTANTWTYITKTIVGDTSGTWLYTNGRGIGIRWDMGVGTTNSVAATNAWGASSGVGVTGTTKLTQTTGATFTITGVQLEKGSTATSFDYRPYGTELALCQRYFQQYQRGVNGVATTTNTINFNLTFVVQMRSAPSVSASGAITATDTIAVSSTQSSANATITGSAVPEGSMVQCLNFSGFTQGRVVMLDPANPNKLQFSAEL